MTNLPFKVEVERATGGGSYFEAFAAFHCQLAAEGYASECAAVNRYFRYRVTKGKKILKEYN